jgi:hypothetical protein
VDIYKEGVGSFFRVLLVMKWEMRLRSGFGIICGWGPVPEGNYYIIV